MKSPKIHKIIAQKNIIPDENITVNILGKNISINSGTVPSTASAAPEVVLDAFDKATKQTIFYESSILINKENNANT